MLEIGKSKIHRYGLFTTKNIKKGEIILKTPFIEVSNCPQLHGHAFVKEARHYLGLDRTNLINGSLKDFNVMHTFKEDLIYIISVQNINKGEEILLKYFK